MADLEVTKVETVVQTDIHDMLKDLMLAKGYISADLHKAESWTSEHFAAFKSMMYHVYGDAVAWMPMNKAQLHPAIVADIASITSVAAPVSVINPAPAPATSTMPSTTTVETDAKDETTVVTSTTEIPTPAPIAPQTASTPTPAAPPPTE